MKKDEGKKEIILSKAQQRVFDFIMDFGSITTLEAYTELGETRLSARVFEMKEKGIPISFEWHTVQNRYGEKRKVKKYTI